jgi:hypothetical protein
LFIFPVLILGLFGGLEISKTSGFRNSSLYVESSTRHPLLVQLMAGIFASPVIIQKLGVWTGIEANSIPANPIVNCLVA